MDGSRRARGRTRRGGAASSRGMTTDRAGRGRSSSRRPGGRGRRWTRRGRGRAR